MNNDQLTKEDLEKLGIHNLGYKLKPRTHFVPYVGECDLHVPCTALGLFQQIFDKGYAAGVAIGKEQKANEIKKALGIDTED